MIIKTDKLSTIREYFHKKPDGSKPSRQMNPHHCKKELLHPTLSNGRGYLSMP